VKKLNNDKTLNEKFIERNNHPIWYHKELYEVDIDYVIEYLLKETFVVDIDGSKHEITFGHNKKENYVGQCIKYGDIKNSGLCSFEVINRGFKEGKWFIITDKDTSVEFKADYKKRQAQYEKEETEKWYKGILSNVIKEHKDLNNEQKDGYLQKINNEWSYEELETLMNSLMGKCK
jgi:hypothetical protein